MARHNKYDLLEKIVQAINDSGWNVLYTKSIDEHPFYLQIYRESESYKVRVYIWHLTHGGGRARPKNEYRIQITGVDHFEVSPDERTLVIGWWKEAEVFAGFDVRKHLGRLGFSPSIQIREEFLKQKLIKTDFPHATRATKKLLSPSDLTSLLNMCATLQSLHDFGQTPEDLTVLEQVAQNPEINDADIQIHDLNRKATVVLVSRETERRKFPKKSINRLRF